MKKLLYVLAGSLLFTGALRAADGGWEADVGVEYFFNGKVKFDRPSFPGGGALPPSAFGTWGRTGPNPGPANQVGDRAYDGGGYVRVGQTTGTDGLTGNFGYDQPASLTPCCGDLTLRASSTASDVTRNVSSYGAANGGSDDVSGLSIIGSLGYGWWVKPNLKVGFGVGFGWMPFESRSANMALGSGTDWQKLTKWTIADSYHAPGGALPDAPYAGSFGSSAYYIPNIPGNRQECSDWEQHYNDWSGSGNIEMDANVFSLYLGPRLTWQKALTSSEKSFFVLGGEGGLSLNWLQADFTQNFAVASATDGGAFSTSRYKQSFSDNDFGLGAYAKIKTGVTFKVGNGTIGPELFAKYHWREELRAGPATADLSGLSVGGQVVWRF